MTKSHCEGDGLALSLDVHTTSNPSTRTNASATSRGVISHLAG
jgi:hypothetical protein